MWQIICQFYQINHSASPSYMEIYLKFQFYTIFFVKISSTWAVKYITVYIINCVLKQRFSIYCRPFMPIINIWLTLWGSKISILQLVGEYLLEHPVSINFMPMNSNRNDYCVIWRLNKIPLTVGEVKWFLYCTMFHLVVACRSYDIFLLPD